MSAVEDLAIRYVTERRAAMEAKRLRRVHTKSGHPDPVPEDGYYYEAPCWLAPDDVATPALPEGSWCPNCVEAQKAHREYRTHARAASGLLRRLENAVRRNQP